MSPRMVSAAKVIDSEYSTFTMSAVELVGLGLGGTIYYVASFS